MFDDKIMASYRVLFNRNIKSRLRKSLSFVTVTLFLFGFGLNGKIPTFSDHFKDWYRQESTSATADPIDNHMFHICVSVTTPFKGGSKYRIKVSARIVESCLIINFENLFRKQGEQSYLKQQDLYQ